MNITASRG
jgi:hypothetical protein